MAPTFDLIGLAVADISRSLAFYRLLGLAIPPELDAEAHVEVILPGGLRMAWDRLEMVRTFDPGWTPPSGSSRIGLAFRCDAPAEVDAVYATLTGAGHPGYLEPWDAFWGQRYAVVTDPDGNSVDLFAALG